MGTDNKFLSLVKTDEVEKFLENFENNKVLFKKEFMGLKVFNHFDDLALIHVFVYSRFTSFDSIVEYFSKGGLVPNSVLGDNSIIVDEVLLDDFYKEYRTLRAMASLEDLGFNLEKTFWTNDYDFYALDFSNLLEVEETLDSLQSVSSVLDLGLMVSKSNI